MVPLRQVLRRCRVVTATVVGVDHARRVLSAVRPEGQPTEIADDVLVMAPGSVAQPLPVPGLAEAAISFKTVGEAIHPRNQVLTASCRSHVVLSDGEEFEADTIVWTVGVRANPLAARSSLPVDVKGRLVCNTELQVRGVSDIWSAGDCAAVRDLSHKDDPDALCGPTGRHAVRQAKHVADNIIATLRGGSPKAYRHPNAGSVASLGLHKGAADIYGVRLRGWLAWFMHRVYHVSRMPTFNRKARVAQ